MDLLRESQHTYLELGQYTGHVFKQKPIDYEPIISNRSYVRVALEQLVVWKADMREF